jgi:hypothetical protein
VLQNATPEEKLNSARKASHGAWRNVAFTVGVLYAGLPGTLLAAEWSLYTDPNLGFSIQVPTEELKVARQEPSRLVLEGAGGFAQLEVFGGRNEKNLSVTDFREAVETADANREITYRAAGGSWFVLSGFMPADAGRGELIFYAKFMFDPARETFSAFEISYPAEQKLDFDATVTKLEKTLRAPGYS